MTPVTMLARMAALALAIVAALGAVLGQGGRWSDQLDILNHFAPIWLAMALAAAALWFVTGASERATPALAMAAALAAALQITPEVLSSWKPRAEAAEAERLTVLQFNLWGRNADPKRTLAWVA